MMVIFSVTCCKCKHFLRTFVQMASKQKIWDPLRRRMVSLTPEERVRQWLIGVLMDPAGVPRHQMMSEVELHFGSSDKVWRADVLVYAHGGAPLAVAECKRPDVPLTPAVLEQALRYNCVLDVRCILITNGVETRVFVRKEEGWTGLDHFPDYEEMLNL